MTLIQMKYFIQIADEKSFTRAANILFVSQSTLSKSISALEAELQTKLINRSVNEFILTEEGTIFYEYANRILTFFNTETEELRKKIGCVHNTIRLGMPPTAGIIYFYSALGVFRREYPDIEIQLTEVPSKVILDLMNAGKIDIGVVLEPFHNSDYILKRVCESEIVLVVPEKHRLVGQESVPFSELKDEKFMMFSPSYMFRDIVETCCKKAGFTPQISLESSQWDLLLELVANGRGVAFFPKPLLDKYSSTKVRKLKLTDPVIPWILSVIYRKDHYLTQPMKFFLDTCMRG